MKRFLTAAMALLIVMIPASVASAMPTVVSATTPIKHLVVLMQGSHSFDNYFGTYRGADGIPKGVCQKINLQVETTKGCVTPFHISPTSAPVDLDHGPAVQKYQYDDGKMDGFVAAYRRTGQDGTGAMGYYDGRELPYYWNLADSFVLFDRFFASTRAGTRESYLYWVAGTAPSSRRAPCATASATTHFPRSSIAWPQGASQPSSTWRTTTRCWPSPRQAAGPDKPACQGSAAVDVPLPYRSGALGYGRRSVPVLPGSARRDAAGRVVRRHDGFQREPAVACRHRAGGRPQDDLCAHAQPLLGDVGIHADVRRMGWVVRPRRAAARRRPWVRFPGSGPSGQPYAKRGFVDHTVLDYTAILRFIEQNWSLAPLAPRDAASAGLASAFDFTSPPAQARIVPATRAAPPSGTAGPHVSTAIYACYGLALLFAVGLMMWTRVRHAQRRRGRETRVA